MKDKQYWRDAYLRLKQIIEERQAFEAQHKIEPYKSHPTTLNFRDVEGRTLLQLAINSGDLNEVMIIYSRGARSEKSLETALNQENPTIAQYLYDQGEDATTVSLYNINNIECQQWFSDLLRKKLNEIVQRAQSQKEFPKDFGNKLFVTFKDFSEQNEQKDHFDRVAELGDLDLLGKLISSGKPFNTSFKWSIDSMMISAASNGRVEFLKWLLTQGTKINNEGKFTASALIVASKNGHLNTVKFLIDAGSEIDYQGENKETALLAAITNRHAEIVHYLLQKKADPSLIDIYGNNALHYAANFNDISITTILFILPDAKDLQKSENIYGMTPLDYGLEKNNVFVTSLIDPTTAKQTETFFVPLNQKPVMLRIRYYLSYQYRDLDFFSNGGHCNGLGFLRDFYAHMEDYYFDTLRMIVCWDGDNSKLSVPFNESLPQAQFYLNLGELLEQWTSDIIWFQHSTLGAIYNDNNEYNHKNRSFQYQVVGNGTMEPILISNPGRGYTDTARFIEDIQLFTKMPSGARLEIGGSEHNTCAFIDKQTQFSYYDPNFTRRARPIINAEIFTRIVVDTKIIGLKKAFDTTGNVEFYSELRFFYYHSNEFKRRLEEHEAFKNEELPTTQEQASLFQATSPNKYTHIHIAILVGSIISLEKLLLTGCVDLHAKTKQGFTALDLALNSRNKKIIETILQAHTIEMPACSSSFINPYKNKDHVILEIMLHQHRKINFISIFFEAIQKKDYAFVKELLLLNCINVNTLYQGRTALVQCLEIGEQSLIKLLLDNGASLLMADKKDQVGCWSSPLKNLMRTNQATIELALNYLTDINSVDDFGNGLIHYLSFAADIDKKFILTKLVSLKADLHKTSLKGKTIFDILNDDFSLDDSVVSDWNRFLIQNVSFEKTNPHHQRTLSILLLKLIKINDLELINYLIPQCDIDTLNSNDYEGISVLLNACGYSNANTVKTLIDKGVNINAVSGRKRNTCLHFLVKKEKYDLIILFLNAGAAVNIPNLDNQTTLDLLSETNNIQIKELFKTSLLLLQYSSMHNNPLKMSQL